MNPYLYISMFRRARLNALASNVAAMPTGGNTLGSDFIARVIADSGTFDSSTKCLAINLQPLISK